MIDQRPSVVDEKTRIGDVNNLLNIAVPFLILWHGLPLTRKPIGLLVTITSLGKLSRYG
jgi:hypothetical protein